MSNINNAQKWCEEHKNDDEFGGDLGKCMDFAESYKTGGKRTRRHHKRAHKHNTRCKNTHKRRTHRKRTHKRRH